VFASLICLVALIGGRLDAQAALTTGLGVGVAGNARATDRTGLQLTFAAQRVLNHSGWIAARIDGMLVDWRRAHPAAVTANVVLYADPASTFSAYAVAGAGVYGIGRQAFGGGNVGVGFRYRIARAPLFTDIRLHELRPRTQPVPALTVGVRL
jgi:hypothetical protein